MCNLYAPGGRKATGRDFPPPPRQTHGSHAAFPGGKGLNQSIAAARGGAHVVHVGAVGEDGAWLWDTLSEAGVDASGVRTVEGASGRRRIDGLRYAPRVRASAIIRAMHYRCVNVNVEAVQAARGDVARALAPS